MVENFIASHLLKYCHFIEDTKGFSMELKLPYISFKEWKILVDLSLKKR